MKYYVYLLISLTLKKKLISYVGYTNNLKKDLLYIITQRVPNLLEVKNGI